MNNRSRSTLFLIEQLIVIAVFALCAAACARILSAAYFSANDSRDLSNAIHTAESCAEAFKAVGGDQEKVTEILGGTLGVNNDVNTVAYYDGDWLVCGKENANYRVVLSVADPTIRDTQLLAGVVSVQKLGGEEIFAITVAAWGNER